MFSNGSRLSFSKLKFLSHLFECSISSLRNTSNVRHFNGKNYFMNKPFNLQYTARCFVSDVSLESPFENINLDSIAKGDDDLKKLKVIILEAEVMRQEGMKVPSVISEDKWKDLLKAPSRSQRLKLLAFWWLNERKKESTKKRKEVKQLKRQESMSDFQEKKDTDHIYYGLGGSSMFLRIYDAAIDALNNNKLIQAMRFGQNLVIDCSYDEHMNSKEASLCASQLKLLFADNRLKDEPFNIHFCNVNKQENVFRMLYKHIPTMYDDSFPLNLHNKSYLDLFPKKQLVYLTPHCRDNLIEFSHDDIYIIGAMVDQVCTDHLSLGKAKAQGLRMARLPLERYLDWGVGGKSLTINQMLLILYELKTTGNWMKALEHVPKRKIKNENFEKRQFSSPRRKPMDFNRLLMT